MSDHIEIDRFSRKSAGYKRAISNYPGARCIEIAVTSSLISGIFDTYNWDKTSDPVVEIMAGSGYLSSHLCDLGFENVTAVEACNDMLAPEGQDRFQRTNIERIEDIGQTISTIDPVVVVSLAGFHHLIRHQGNRIDLSGSVLW